MLFATAATHASTKRHLLLLALVLGLGSLAIGCGGNVVVDHGGDGQGGAGGSSNPSKFGTPEAACLLHESGIDICEQVFDASPTIAAELKSGCPSSKGHVVAACASDGLLGCCVIGVPGGPGKLEECFYGGVAVQMLQQLCHEQKGTFSTSP